MQFRFSISLVCSVILLVGPMFSSAQAPKKITEGKVAGEVREFGGMIFVWCPPGEFVMGSPESESGHKMEENEPSKEYRLPDETQHPVEITKGFWLAMHECTQSQYSKFMELSKGTTNSIFGAGDEYPVNYVTWSDAQEYCQKLSAEIGTNPEWRVDLPTEAQWEYACRAGSKGPWAGDIGEMAWYRSNSGEKSHPVGEKKPNAWELRDMHGSVFEWCRNWAENEYEKDRVRDPVGPASGSKRIIRGGSFGNSALQCRSAFRMAFDPKVTAAGIGFRVAIVAAD
ncbi:MAG: formylglycine-generating enzyme family protein [Verrucomicrobiota bacterium]